MGEVFLTVRPTCDGLVVASEKGVGHMKKLVVLAAVCGVAVFLAVPIVHAGGALDFAVGGFQGVGGVNKVGFSATSDPSGANPNGYLTQTIPQGRKDNFTVTCLAVTGNHAAIGLTAANAPTAANFPHGRVLVVIDNGTPAAPSQTVDTYGYVNGTNDCTQYTTTAVTNLPENGNITVHDQP
jgi:hypothetical protein